MPITRLSEEHFQSAAARSRMEPQSIELARHVLVLGKRQAAVAKQFRVTRSWVSEIVKKMLHCATQLDEIPPGWKSDVAVLPPALWKIVRKLERDARSKIGKTKAKRL